MASNTSIGVTRPWIVPYSSMTSATYPGALRSLAINSMTPSDSVTISAGCTLADASMRPC